jgi:integrase
VKLKKAQKVRYWIAYRVPGGKQSWKSIGFSVEEARAAEGKVKAQKYENPGILEKVTWEKKTFAELAAWYIGLKSTKGLASYDRVGQALANFNASLGSRAVGSLKPVDLEDYQQKRLGEGRAPATVDMETTIAKTMVTKAFDNDMIGARPLKAFRAVKRTLRKAANGRRETLDVGQYLELTQAAPAHLAALLILAYNTGMRLGELRALRWLYIDKGKRVIRLSADLTKEARDKVIPMNHHVLEALETLPRAIHHDFVLTYRSEPITGPGGLKKSFQETCGKANIPYGRRVSGGLIFHDIRRTVKTNMLAAGVDKRYCDLILGHSLQGMDAYYIAPSEEDLHRAMARYTEWLDNEIEARHVSQNVNHA